MTNAENAPSPVARAFSSLLKRGLLTFPRKIQIETTTACNSNCIMCPHASIRRAKGPMDRALFARIIDECSENSRHVRELYPFLNGELFLTPRWEEYLSYAREKLPSAKLSVFTNGSLLGKENAAKLLEIGPDLVNISFDGTDKAAYESIRRNLCFEEVEANISGFIAARKKTGLRRPFISISIIDMEKTRSGIPSFVEKWRGRADRVSVEPYSTWGGTVADLSAGGRPALPRVSCPRLWYNLTVLNSGRAALCCLDHEGAVSPGDLNSNSIREIWRGAVLREIRRRHERGLYSGLPLCENCDYGKYQKETPFWWR